MARVLSQWTLPYEKDDDAFPPQVSTDSTTASSSDGGFNMILPGETRSEKVEVSLSPVSSLAQFLQEFGFELDDAKKLVPKLAHEGVKVPSDLRILGRADIAEVIKIHKLNRVESRKLENAWAELAHEYPVKVSSQQLKLANQLEGLDKDLVGTHLKVSSQQLKLAKQLAELDNDLEAYGADEDDDEHRVQPAEAEVKKAPGQGKLVIFTVNLLIGLLFSQFVPQWLDGTAYGWWAHVVKLGTMWCLSYIMVHVGYEFDIDKTRLWSYGKDYLIAMTAAGFPWIFVAAWFVLALPTPMPMSEALIAARFAAPTSAGILFSMLEAAGMKETWLFQKARVLAIFDDLDTILLMVPLKVMIVGMRWELSIDLGVVVVLFVLIFLYMHKLRLPCSWQATMVYASCVTIVCELAHFLSHDERIDPHDVIDTVHLEVLLPAFAIGCLAYCEHEHSAERQHSRRNSGMERSKSFVNRLQRMPTAIGNTFSCLSGESVNTFISAVFMIFVGLSMPALFAPVDAHGHRRLASASSSSSFGSDVSDSESLGFGLLLGHVAMVSILMILGKMFPLFCYKDEANLRTRLALSLGMCPRGEVGAGVIVISLSFGIWGNAITIAVLCLAINLVLSSVFIMLVKKLAKEEVAVA